VAAYSLRATPIPSVSTPVGWGELEEALIGDNADALSFEPAEVLNRLEGGARAMPTSRFFRRLDPSARE